MHLGHSTALQFKMRSSYQEGGLLLHIFKSSFVLFSKKWEKILNSTFHDSTKILKTGPSSARYIMSTE